jgi:ketosteroid isomerase-like protein
VDHRLHDGLHPLAASAADHIETIRRGHAAFSRGDVSFAAESISPDAQWRTTGIFPGVHGVYYGPEAVEQWMGTIRAEWEEFEISLQEVLGETEEAVVVEERLWGRGRESGVETAMEIYSIYRFDPEGKVTMRNAFATADEALKEL